MGIEMSTNPETKLILCSCHSPEHQIILTYWPDDEPYEKTLFVEIHLVTYDNFFKRLWAGLRYAFGHHSRYGHWDELLLTTDEGKEVWDFLCGFLQNKNTGVNAPDDAEWQHQNRVARQAG